MNGVVDPYEAPPPKSGPANDAEPWSGRVVSCTAEWFTNTPPKRTWILRDSRTTDCAGVLPQGKVGLLIAEGGLGKTMVLVQFAIALATGENWLGIFLVLTRMRVLLLLGEEDHDEVVRRAYRSRRSTNSPIPEPGSIVVLPLAGIPCTMIESDGRGNWQDAPFLVWLRAFIKKHGPFDVVIVDPFSRFAGADAETDNAAATRFVQSLESIACDGPTVIAAHHVNKPSRGDGADVTSASSRGASAITDGVRWVSALSAQKVPCDDPALAERLGEVVTFKVTKSNYSRKGEPVLLRRDNDNGGALLPLDDVDQQTVADLRRGASASTRRRAERDAERDAREARDAAKRAQREAASTAKNDARRAAEDDALRACVTTEPGIHEAELISAMRARLGMCSDGATRAAVARARLAGWLDVRTGPKNAKCHFLKGAP